MENLVEILTIIINGQNSYGRKRSVDDVFKYFKYKLEGKYNVSQVIYAIDKYTDTKNDIPEPADINNILNPQKPRITEAQYVQAQKWQERNGYPVFSDAKDIVDGYKEQYQEQSREYNNSSEKIKQLSGNNVKKLTPPTQEQIDQVADVVAQARKNLKAGVFDGE